MASKTYRYRYTGEGPALLPDIHRTVEPGDVIETDRPINNPNFEAITDAKPARAKEEN